MIPVRRTIIAVTTVLAGAATVAVVIPGAGHAADCTSTVSNTSAASTAVGSAAAGATVCLADGTYGKLSLNAAKAAPGVTIRAEHPGKATIAGASLSGSYLTLAQFNVTDEVDLMPGSTGMTVSHNRISGGYFGVQAGPTSTTQVSDATIVANRLVGPFGEDAIRANRYHDGPDADPYGLLVEGNEITNVRENGNHSDCLQAVWVGDGMYFRRNYLHDNRCQGFFIKDQASTVENVVAENNLFLRNDAACAVAGCGQPSVFQLFGPMDGLVIRRNTIWTPGGESPITLRDGGWGSVLIESNVLYRPWSDTTAPFGSSYTATNNIAGSAPEGTWPRTGITILASPAFQNPSADDYRTNDGRGVDWAPADQSYGPDGSSDVGGDDGGGGGTPPPADDTTAPNTTITSGPTGAINDATPTFAFDADESGATFSCRVDSSAWADCASPWTTQSLDDGQHAVSVRASDAAGNTETSAATRSFTVDTASPHTTITSPPPATSTSDRASIAFTVDESGSSSQCRVDAGDWAGCTSPYEVSGLQPGAHTVIVRSSDSAGNVESPGASASWTVEGEPGGDPGEPPPTTDAPPTAGLTAPTAGRVVAGDFTLAASASDDHGVAHVDFWVDDTRVSRDTSAPYEASADAGELSAGTHTVAVRAFDAPGQAASAAVTVRVASGGRGEWSRRRRSAQLTSAPSDGGVTQLTGRTSSNGLVRVDLTPCDSADATVADRFTLRADEAGRLDAAYSGAGLCVLALVLTR
jgi:Bacterial Ig domain/Bacterial Ig-like domain/Right handed beta helix region